MAGVLDLTKVLQFVEDRLNQGTTAQNGFFELGAWHRFYVFLEGGVMSWRSCRATTFLSPNSGYV